MKTKKAVNKTLVHEWIEKAIDDKLNAKSILTHRDGSPNGVCFFSQQSAEKYLKAFLISYKGRFPKTHSLLYLLNLCVKIEKEFINLKEEAIFLDGFYIPTRYPGDYPIFGWKDAEKAFNYAEKIKVFVLKKLNLDKTLNFI